MAKFDASALPAPTRITLKRSIDEGVLLAEYATRMEAKNQVIVGALRGEQGFDLPHYAAIVRQSLAKLAEEAEEQARRIGEARQRALGNPGVADGHHDYRRGDVGNLRLREESYSGLAAALRGFARDDDYVHGIVEQARQAAWGEVGDVVVSTLIEQQAPADLGENYAEERLIRMQLLQIEDLEQLETERRHRVNRLRTASSLSSDVEGEQAV